MSAGRPAPPDQPSLEETEALRASLAASVAHGRRLQSATTVVRGPQARCVWVLLDEAGPGRATLLYTDLGRVAGERTVEAGWLLEQLGGKPRFDDLAAVIVEEDDND